MSHHEKPFSNKRRRWLLSLLLSCLRYFIVCLLCSSLAVSSDQTSPTNAMVYNVNTIQKPKYQIHTISSSTFKWNAWNICAKPTTIKRPKIFSNLMWFKWRQNQNSWHTYKCEKLHYGFSRYTASILSRK